jgi:hypothetical protein
MNDSEVPIPGVQVGFLNDCNREATVHPQSGNSCLVPKMAFPKKWGIARPTFKDQ